jgi:hypothetical protein
MYIIKAPKTYSSKADDYKPFPVTFLLTGDALENLAREVLKMLKLFTESDIGGYNRLFNADIVKHFMNELGETKQAIAEAKKKKKLSLSLNVSVATEIIEKINIYLANPNAAPPKPVSEMSAEEKLGEVIKRAALLLPANIGKELLALLDPTTLAIVAAVVVAWAVSHFFGIGEIADVIMLIVGVVSLGPIAWKAGEHLISFANYTINGKTDKDLSEAAKHLSEAIALIGVQVVMALLLKKAPKVFNEPRIGMGNKEIVTPFTFKEFPKAPTTKGSLFYKPKVERTTRLTEGFGETNIWGNSKYSMLGTLESQRLARIHEQVHSTLTPKLQIFREVRCFIRINGYFKSYLLRYLEEALAETIARVTVNGFREVFTGITFPVKNGYVSIAKMGVEAMGILLGPINLSGMTFNVYLTFAEPSK